MKTLTTSEFVSLVLDTIPYMIGNSSDRFVYSKNTEYIDEAQRILSVQEMTNGKSYAFVNGISYSKLTASQKREAVEMVKSINVEISEKMFSHDSQRLIKVLVA